ncbi:MAG: 5'-3' exonuclease H3TH domain-containing protein, partial [Verrucomicrobiae bacterium]|nr:5'-3' exonuclease H3TH domain-containing protein [Verrucomicrobiae bacterium]
FWLFTRRHRRFNPGMRLLLVDGHYYAYRSFFAIMGLRNSAGEPTNAVFGFAKALRRMLVDLKPDRAAVVFDGGLPAARMELLPQYKQNREEMPADLRIQLPRIESITSLLGWQKIIVEGHEADDVMASYALQARSLGHEVIFATKDKDLMQLVDGSLKIYAPGREDFELIDERGVQAKWGVSPAQIADLLALTGDASDNIPGVPGIGPKTAAKLINEFGSLDALLQNAALLKGKSGEALRTHLDAVEVARKMVRLETSLPLPVPFKELLISPQYPELIAELKRLEFKTLTREVETEAGQATTKVPSSTHQGELF